MANNMQNEVISDLKKEQKGIEDWKVSCKHEWRIIENFFSEISKYQRVYPAYCVHCLEIKQEKINL